MLSTDCECMKKGKECTQPDKRYFLEKWSGVGTD